MKKLFPILLALLCFTGFLVIQVGFDQFRSSASQGKGSEKNALYENLFNTLELKTLAGISYKLATLPQKVVILNFWASWCAPCLEEFPGLRNMMELYDPKDLIVFGINNDDADSNPIEIISEIVENYQLKFKSVYDLGGVITNKFFINAIPVSIIFINKKVHKITFGAFEFDSSELVNELDSVIPRRQ